ncbi:hypothetical protein Tco_1082236 [Tanacetum coccineum]|uniref:Uncharacterized protein n=1 Tax=Tanacetum coccineum TaxID=301880 RepID=A0ABQ5HZR7_9ASTR
MKTQKPRKAKGTTEISQSSGPISPCLQMKTNQKEREENRIGKWLSSTGFYLRIITDSVNTVRLNLLLPALVYAGRHSLTAVRHKLMLPGITSYCWIQALVDKKKVIISETSIKSDLKLDDAEETDYLPTATIYAELERMGEECIPNMGGKVAILILIARSYFVHASTKTFSSSHSQLPQVKDKGKEKMVEPKVPLKKKDQVALYKEMARNLEAQLQAELIKREACKAKGRRPTLAFN